jgi:hypothetical protein
MGSQIMPQMNRESKVTITLIIILMMWLINVFLMIS